MTLLPSLPLQLPHVLRHKSGKMNFKVRLPIAGIRHTYRLFRMNSRCVASKSAMTFSIGIPFSITVYFCKSAAENSRRDLA